MIAQGTNSNDSSTEENAEENLETKTTKDVLKTETTLTKNAQNKPTKEKTSLKSLAFFTLIVIAIVLPIRIYVAKPFIVSGTSMLNSFQTWNYLIVDQLTYRLAQPQRGDVIVFRYPRDPSRFFIKRIIGLPDETVILKGTKVTIINKKYPKGDRKSVV